MTPERYRDVLDAIGMSQVGAAKFLGISPRESRKFAAGDADIPPAIAMLLEIMTARRIKPDTACKLAGLDPIEGINRSPGRPKRN